jgi:anti-sigma B factor antagonist
MSFQATVRQKGDVAVVDLAGRLILGEASHTLQEAILALILAGQKKILLNLTDVSHLDSAGLGEMCAACASVTNSGGEIRLVTPVRIHDQMEVTKLSTVFADYPDEVAAAESFRREPTKV